MSRFQFRMTAVVLAMTSGFVLAANPYPSVPLYLDQATVKPNIAILFDTSGSMKDTPDNQKTSDVSASKLGIARAALSNIFSDSSVYSMAYWSLFTFDTTKDNATNTSVQKVAWTNPSSTSNQSTLKTTINGLSADSDTPSASAFYNITRAFAGVKGYSDGGTAADYSGASPIKYACQKNFVIFLSDGYPNADGNLNITTSDYKKT